MLKTQLQPDREYRLNELAEVIGKTRTTIDRYLERFQIKTTTVIHMGKQVQAAILSEENIKQILSLNPELAEEQQAGDHPYVKEDDHNVTSPFKLRDDMFKQVDTLREKLHQVELENASLREKVCGMTNELRRADEQIDVLKQSNTSLQRTLQATLLLEGQKHQTINLVPEKATSSTEDSHKKTFSDRIKALKAAFF